MELLLFAWSCMSVGRSPQRGMWLCRKLWQDGLDEAHREEAPWLLVYSLASRWISLLFYRCVYCELRRKLRLENVTTKIVWLVLDATCQLMIIAFVYCVWDLIKPGSGFLPCVDRWPSFLAIGGTCHYKNVCVSGEDQVTKGKWISIYPSFAG